MRKWLLIFAVILFAVAAFGQTGNTFYVRHFPGITVGQKLTAAQNACNATSDIPCILVLGPELAAYPQGTLPTKCAQCVWWDYRTTTGANGLENITGGTGITCSTVSDQVSCALDGDLPGSETIGGESIATEQWVQNQTSNAFIDLNYGEANTTTAPGDNTVTFASAPIPGSIDLWQGSNLIPPSDYSVTGSTLNLEGYVFPAGVALSAFWQTQAVVPGGISVSASSSLSAQVRQTFTGSGPIGTESSYSFPLPPETQAGDLVIIAYTTSYNGYTLYFPSQFTESISNNGYIDGGFRGWVGIVTAAEVQAGAVIATESSSASSNIAYSVIDFVGATGGVVEYDEGDQLGASGTINTSAAVKAGDAILSIGSSALESAISISPGTEISSIVGLYTEEVAIKPVSVAGAQAIGFTFAASQTNNSGAVVVVAPPVTESPLLVESANMVLAGPASGGASLPSYRKLTAADLPAGIDLSTVPDTVTPATFPAIQSASTSTGCTTGTASYDVCSMSVTWPLAFSDAKYQVQCIGTDPTDSGNPTSGRAVQNGITAQTTTGVTIQFATQGSNAVSFTGMECTAMQNAGE